MIITEETPLEEEQTGEEEQPGEDETQEPSPVENEESQDDAAEIEGLQITFGDEKPKEDEDETPAPKWVKELRKRHTELKRQNRELREKIQTYEKPQVPEGLPPEPGQMPTIESCDYDQERFNREAKAWYEQKNAREKALEKIERDRQLADAEYRKRLERYAEKKESLSVHDFDEAEELVKDTFNVTQQGIIVHGADDPALVVYALGRNPIKAKELSKIDDPIRFAFAAAKLEAQMKISKTKKPAAKPEKTVTSSGPVSGAVDSQLTRLRAEAEKTGDYTKVNAYKRQKRRSGK